jgi:hypothetical protein
LILLLPVDSAAVVVDSAAAVATELLPLLLKLQNN